MTKYRQKDNEAVIKVTNDVEVTIESVWLKDIVLAIQDRRSQRWKGGGIRERYHIFVY